MIPKETYNGQTEDIQTVGVKAVLLASDNLSVDTVKDITEILFKNKQELQYSLPVDISIDEKSAVEGVTIPFHEGAAAYYDFIAGKRSGLDLNAVPNLKLGE